MPRYFFVCTESTGGCGTKVSRITRKPLHEMSEEDQFKLLHCKCGRRYHSDYRPPTSQKKEILDNGAMLHRIERPANAEELAKDRAKNDPSKKR